MKSKKMDRTFAKRLKAKHPNILGVNQRGGVATAVDGAFARIARGDNSLHLPRAEAPRPKEKPAPVSAEDAMDAMDAALSVEDAMAQAQDWFDERAKAEQAKAEKEKERPRETVEPETETPAERAEKLARSVPGLHARFDLRTELTPCAGPLLDRPYMVLACADRFPVDLVAFAGSRRAETLEPPQVFVLRGGEWFRNGCKFRLLGKVLEVDDLRKLSKRVLVCRVQFMGGAHKIR